MSEVVLKIENVSKQYRLGLVGTGTLSHDLKRWWYLIRGKEDPFLKVGEVNYREVKGGEYVNALSAINLEIKKGEVVGIIGENGAGKSTLLKLLSEVTTPTTGSIKIKGRIAALLEVGTGFHPELTGRENIFLNGAILGMTKPEISQKLDEIIDFSGVAKYVDTPVKRYSSGMKVRLGFAVAAHLEPEILIVDEVLAVGDAEFQKKCIGKMKDVAGEGRTVLFVSHNMISIKSLCDRGVVLDKGEIVFKGGVDEAVSYYLNSTEESIAIPLCDRENRQGNGKIKITDCYFIDDTGMKSKELISGLSGKLILEYEKSGNLSPRDLFVGVNFFDENDIIQTVIANDELGVKFDKIDNKGFFTIEFEKLAFRAGRYHYSIFISEKLNNSAEHVKLDVIQNAGELLVAQGDFWGVGNVNRPKGFIMDVKMF